MKKIIFFGFSFFLFYIQNANGSVAYKRLIDTLITKADVKREAMPVEKSVSTEAPQNLMYHEQSVDDNNKASNVVVSNGPDAFHSIVLNYSMEQLVIIKFHKNDDVENIKTYQKIADSFKNQALLVSINIEANPMNKDLLTEVENSLGLKQDMELPIYLFCKDRKLLMPIRHGSYSQEVLETIIKQYIEFLMANPGSQGIQSSIKKIDSNIYVKNDLTKLSSLKKSKHSIWKKKAKAYKKFEAIF